jgi:UDP-3-O-[3-hydroxymyristoyl] glucosamine N-acyltransferase
MPFKASNYQYKGPFKLADLAKIIGCEVDNKFSNLEITDLAPLSTANAGQLTFFDNPKYLEQFKKTKAEACIVNRKYAVEAPAGIALLVTDEPYRAYAKVAQKFFAPVIDEPRIHPTASIDPTAKIGKDCIIGAYTVIGKEVEIGDNTRIYSNVSIQTATIGKDCIIHSGVRIGQDGFGFAMGKGEHYKVPQLGGVIIGNNVEIGANTCVDRGSGPDTIIGDGTKIDNLVQIGHNVEIGRNCVIVAQVGIAGSTKLGDYVVVGGQTGIAGHIKVGTGAKIAGLAGVMRNVEPGKTVGGFPAVDIRDWHKSTLLIQKLIKEKNDN